jgi:hypothetical protein
VAAATHAADAETTLVKRALVPSARKPQGEVRLLQREDGVVLQTLLYTKLLKRVTRTIARKERRLWTADTPHHADAQRYIEALEKARQAVETAADDDDDRRRELLIEFILRRNLAVVVIAVPRYDESEAPLRIRGQRELTVLVPSREYIAADIREIVQDTFELDDNAATELLQPLYARAAPADGQGHDDGKVKE